MILRLFNRLLVCALMVLAAPAMAQEAHLRVIVIDNNLYGGIANASDRNAAVDDFIADVDRIFGARDVARYGEIDTLFVYFDGGRLDLVRDISPRNALADLPNSQLIKDMENGRAAPDYGLSVDQLREQLHDVLRQYRMRRLAPGEERQIDLHIFASRWVRSERSAEGNMLTQEYPALCYQQQDRNLKPWPQNITLGVEIRTPQGYPIPTRHALHGLMTVLSGSASVSGNVMMRGNTTRGPDCDMSPTLNAFPQASTVSNSALECGTPVVFSESDLDTQPRCEITDHPAIGTSLVEAPVHLVSRAQTVSLGAFTFEAQGRNMTTQITTGVAGPVLFPRPGATQTPPRGSGTRAPAELELLPEAGCQPRDVTEADLRSQQGGSIQVAASRAACRDTTISIGEVTLP